MENPSFAKIVNKTAFSFIFIFPMSLSSNQVWLNTPSIVYGANTPISLSVIRKVSCFQYLSVALEYSGNTPANTISLVCRWFDHNQYPLFDETLISDTVSSANNTTIVSVKGAYAILEIRGSINPTFSAAVQAFLKNV